MTRDSFSLFGFDIREKCSKDLAKSWSQERRNIFLLDNTTAIPLSVDRNVWPAVGLSENLLLSEQSPLWLNHESMTNHVSNCFQKRDFFADEIIVEIYNDEHYRANEHWGKYCNPVDKGVVKEQFHPLGYDVADAGLISSLVNCGFEPAEKVIINRYFCNYLNEYGLFNELEAAQRFVMLSERRIPEHTPFFVYRILKKQIGTSK